MGMLPVNAWASDESAESEEAIGLAIGLLRREIDELLERAEALERPLVAAHLEQASDLCSLEVPDPEDR